MERTQQKSQSQCCNHRPYVKSPVMLCHTAQESCYIYQRWMKSESAEIFRSKFNGSLKGLSLNYFSKQKTKQNKNPCLWPLLASLSVRNRSYHEAWRTVEQSAAYSQSGVCGRRRRGGWERNEQDKTKEEDLEQNEFSLIQWLHGLNYKTRVYWLTVLIDLVWSSFGCPCKVHFEMITVLLPIWLQKESSHIPL